MSEGKITVALLKLRDYAFVPITRIEPEHETRFGQFSVCRQG